MRILHFSCCCAWWLVFASLASAQLPDLPRSLARAALSEQAPSAAPAVALDVDDFALVPMSGSDPTIRARLEPGSLRWVRVGHLLRVPRAVAVIEVGKVEAGRVEHSGFSHPIVNEARGGRAEVEVALLSSEAANLRVETRRRGQPANAGFAVRFRPRAHKGGQIGIDTSCSPYGVTTTGGSIPHDSWLVVACRALRTGRKEHTSLTLELYLLWDHVGSTISVSGAAVQASQDGLFTERVNTKPGNLTLAARSNALALRYFLPDPFHAAFLGAGIGPALYTFDGPGRSIKTAVPLLTLYAGYSFDPVTRLVYFSALAGHERGYLGQGLYLWLEQFRAFDERLSMNLLLGANLLIYRRRQRVVTRISAPQGVEFILRDVGRINRNLTVGAFLYPDISGSAYYDGWIRWGSPRFFGELNFLYWREPHSTGSTRSQTLGLSFGMPLLRFL